MSRLHHRVAARDLEPTAFTTYVGRCHVGSGVAPRELQFTRAVSKEGINKLRNDVRQRPGEAEAWYELAAAALDDGELVEARDAMNRVLERAPDHVGANRALGTILG